MRGLRHVGLLPTGIGRVLTKIDKKGGNFFAEVKELSNNQNRLHKKKLKNKNTVKINK